jgi:hypothetical protein
LPEVLESDAQRGCNEVRITFPDNGDIFKIDKVLDRAYQRLVCEAVVPSLVDSVEVFVDGKRAARIGYPFRYGWSLDAGDHVVEYRAGSRPRMIDRVAFRVLP